MACSSRSPEGLALAALLTVLATSCAAPARAPRATPAPAPSPLPPLVVEVLPAAPDPELEYGLLPPPGTVQPPAVDSGPQPITLTATNADLRALILALADALDYDIVLDPEVRGRVSVRFDGVPADVALGAVLDAAGLSIAAGGIKPPYGDVSFYPVPIDVELADLETLMRRYGISRELAEWVVRSRLGYRATLR